MSSKQNNTSFTNIYKILDILVEETGPGVVLRNVQICAKFRCPAVTVLGAFVLTLNWELPRSFVNQMLILQVSVTCPSKS